MKKISETLIISDVDGTLLNDKGLPQRNIDAIRRYIGRGGRFGIATGRARAIMREAAKTVPINAPCVLYNGGALYDYGADRILWEQLLQDSALEITRELMEQAPYTGVLVVQNDCYYRVRRLAALDSFIEARGRDNFKSAALDEISQPWHKVLFQVEECNYARFMEFVGNRSDPGIRYLGTSVNLIEMLPIDSDKGFALKKLVDLGYAEQENILAVGDFYNDVGMLKYAGIGVTLSTSPDDVKAVADLVVGDCGGGAVADAIEYLEKLCGY